MTVSPAEVATPPSWPSSDFRVLLAGEIFSWVGNAYQAVALPVAVALGGGSAGQLGAVIATQIGARIACTLGGGVVADRLSRRMVMVTSDAVSLVCAVGLAALFAGHAWHTLPLVLLVAVMSGAASFFTPAFLSLRVALVPTSHRATANARISMAENASRIIGPATAGLVVAWAGPTTGFLVNAATFLASMVAVLGVRTRVTSAPTTESLLVQLAGGWRAVRARRWMVTGLASAAVYHLANGVMVVLAPLVVVRHFGGSEGYGWVAAAEGVGGVTGAWLAARTHLRHPLITSYVAMSAMGLWASSFAWGPDVIAIIVASAISYAALFFGDVLWLSAVQADVPHELLGRVSSWDTTVSFVMLPFGSALAGVVSRSLGWRTSAWVCAVIMAGSLLAALLDPAFRQFSMPALESADAEI